MKFKNYIETESGIKDTSASPGAAGQVLSSTVTGTSWITLASGNVSGTGTTNNMTKWSNTTGGLTDALMTDNGSTVALSTDGSANTFNLFHTSGSGVALNIQKGGNNEGLIVNKTSGSGNAVSITGDSYFNGDVGIGTPIPNSKLQVDGEIDANGADGYRINGRPWANESSNILRLGDWEGDGFSTSVFDENSIEMLRVVDEAVIISSNVSKTPAYGSTANLVVGGSKSSPYGEGVLTLLNNDPTSSTGDKTGSIQFAIKDDATNGYASSSITGSINSPAGSGSSGGGILDFKTSFGQTGSTPQTRMRINYNGNVGVNSTNPYSKLHVASNTTGDTPTAGTATGGLWVSTSAQTFGINMGVSGSGWGFIQSQRADGTTALYNLNLQPLGGSVGIGTTDPKTKLHVFGTTSSMPALGAAPSATQIGGNTFGTLFSTLTSGKGVIQQGKSDGTSTPYDLLLQPVGGNVGIGTSSASDRLEVAAVNSQLRLTDTDDSKFTQFSYSSGKLVVRNNSTTTTTNQFTFDLDGKMGIGTTSPGTGAPAGTKLHVVGGIHSSTFVNAVNGLGIYSTSMGSGRGLSLYGQAQLYPQYGMLFATTSDLGTHGSVTGDFATYMTMTGTGRGWVWKSGSVNSTSGNVASINVSGALTLNSTATATNFILSSDETLKDNIKEISVKHVDVNWKNFELKSEPGIKRAGVIAQELEVKHPEFVRTASDGIKSVAYIDLLITKIAELEARLEKAGL